MRPHLLFSFVKDLNKRNQLNPLFHETKERNQQSDQCFVRCVWSLVYKNYSVSVDVSLSLFLFTTVHVGNEGQDSTTVQSDPLLL